MIQVRTSPPLRRSPDRGFRRKLAATFATLAVATSAWAAAVDPVPPVHGPFPSLRLGGITRGEAAIRGLGNALPEVARAYGRQPDELRELLRTDHTLAVDNEGRLHFTDDPLPADPGLLAPSTPPEAASYPLSSTFQLHSRPGSKRTLYIDFNGHTITGTVWNANYTGGATINAPAFDIDGNPAAFSDTELTRIQQIWKRVAEDYAAFDVDVTTALAGEDLLTRSSSTDDVYGVRVLVSAISYLVGNYGGYAYIGCFNQVGDYYKPALVFPENLAYGEKYIGEAVAHEAGHTLGLSHDGTTSGTTYYAGQGSGETGWAPIMGNGYYQNLTQWSKGEYSGANNKEDDLAVIQTRGLSPVADDYGSTDATAGFLPASASPSVQGFIGLGGDVDVFAIATGAGTATFTVAPATLGPDLDLALQVYSSAGVLLGTANPTDRLSASLALTVPAGTYFVRVYGTGAGDPLTTGHSAYAAQGLYKLSATVPDPTGTVAPVAVATSSATGGTAPVAITFDGRGSFDQDGSVVAWDWTFGDGTGATGSTVSHTFTGVGTFNTVLTVTDAQGLTSTDTVTIVVQPASAPQIVIRVASITITTQKVASGTTGTAKIKVTAADGTAVGGVTVTGQWSGVITGSASGTTDATGVATITSKAFKKSGTLTFTVSSLAKTGCTYDKTQNLASSGSIAASTAR